MVQDLFFVVVVELNTEEIAALMTISLLWSVDACKACSLQIQSWSRLSYLNSWFPSNERASAVGISMAGFHFGNVIGLLLTPIMFSTIGISGPFILFSSLGLLWVTTWAYLVADDPQESSVISRSELRLIQAGKTASPPKSSKFPPLSLLLSKLPSWAIIFANATNNWVSSICLWVVRMAYQFWIALLILILLNLQGYFVLLSWMPVYFKSVITFLICS